MFYGEFGRAMVELTELQASWLLRREAMSEQEQQANRSRVGEIRNYLDRLNLCDMSRGCQKSECPFNRRAIAEPGAVPAGRDRRAE